MQKTKLLIALLFCVAIAKAQNIPDSIFSQLRFRFIGPDGNRTIAVAGEPGNPMVSYVGAASGGIFKTEDAGISWRSIFDGQDVSSIGALAIAPSNHNHVWAGTGETFLIRPAHAMGNGVYKSTDAGKTWKNMGLQVTARISRVIVHPTDTNIVYVAALGHTHAPQQERGVYKTTDGGKTWERVLFVDENTGCSDLSIDPQHPDILYAAMWQVEIKTWGLKSGGPGSGIYRTKDGGKTWEPLRNGLPGGINHPVGKTSVDVAYSNPNIVYALIEDKAPGIYRSEDGGDSWKLMSQNHSFAQRAPYYTRIRVSTKDPNQIHTICVTIMTSKDGGKTFTSPHGDYRGGGDNHDMWFDPADANRIMVAHDGCLNMTFNGGKTWSNINLPVAQMYHVAVDNQIPYNVYGNRQDGYSYKAPGISLQGSIPLGLWTGVGGCESGFAQPDPVDNTIVWSGCYDGGLDVTDTKTGYSRDVRAWPEAGYGWAPANMQYRWHWNFPLMISKHNHNTVLVGSQYVHQTTNGGQSWKIISPDLTTNDKTHQQNSGGMNSDNLMTFDGCTLYSIAESPVKEGIIWTGSNDGQVNITTDGGNHWKNVTANIPDLPKWGTIRNIDPSNFDAGTCYISVNFQQVGNFDPYIYKTTDYGTTWKLISNGIPKSNSSFVHQIKEDPAKKGLLWAGTDNALYFSPDDGNNWIHVKNNLPPAPIYGIAIQQNFNDLVLATYGRGFYILDDITPFRQITTTVLQSPVHLFNTRKTYRFRDKNGIHTENSFVTGQNPPYGASINYYLKDKTADTVKMLVKDNKGNIVRHLETTDTTGINRVWWDLSYDAINLPSLKTKPRGKDWVPLDSNGNRNMFIYD
ncbi:MAG: glycosyl hydrolase, partial [Sphingobacteriales bacterium]|nr:glycosyl hydrolase [Sphingobacteriales bacterium]